MQAWREAARSRPEWMRSTAKPERPELRDLVLHQRDERADDQRGAAARDAGQLVAERFAGARGHDEQDVPALDRRLRQTSSWLGRKEAKPKARWRRSVRDVMRGAATVAAVRGDGRRDQRR